MKIQITNFYKLSIILFILSGCKELEELQFYNQDIFPIGNSNHHEMTNKNSKVDNFENVSKESNQNVFVLKKSNINENLDNISVETGKHVYSGLTKLKSSKIILDDFTIYYQTKKEVVKKNEYIKPTISIDFDISKINYFLALKDKSVFQRNSLFHSKVNIGYDFIKLETLSSISKSDLIKLLDYPDYTRKHSDIYTFQYRFNACVIDFFFKEASEKLSFYNIRPRDYKGVLSNEKCLLELNLRKIYRN